MELRDQIALLQSKLATREEELRVLRAAVASPEGSGKTKKIQQLGETVSYLRAHLLRANQAVGVRPEDMASLRRTVRTVIDDLRSHFRLLDSSESEEARLALCLADHLEAEEQRLATRIDPTMPFAYLRQRGRQGWTAEVICGGPSVEASTPEKALRKLADALSQPG
jgi:uncharacterized protein YecE (DUF72 family)